MKHLLTQIDQSSLPLDVKLDLRVLAAIVQYAEDTGAMPTRALLAHRCRQHGLQVEENDPITRNSPLATARWLRDLLFTAPDQEMTIREVRLRLSAIEQQDAPLSALP